MQYDDYKILTDEEYSKLNSQYNQNQTTDRIKYIHKITTQLQNIVNSYLIETPSITLNSSIKELKDICKKILNNLPQNNISNNNFFHCNIFKLLEISNDVILEFTTWLCNENKEYYKEIVIHSINDLSICNKKILEKIQNLNIKIYKFM